MEFKYFEIMFNNGKIAYIETIPLSKAEKITNDIGNCKLTGTVTDKANALYSGSDIYFLSMM